MGRSYSIIALLALAASSALGWNLVGRTTWAGGLSNPIITDGLVFWLPFDDYSAIDPINGIEGYKLTDVGVSNFVTYSTWDADRESYSRQRTEIITNSLFIASYWQSAATNTNDFPGIAGLRFPLAGTTMEKDYTEYTVCFWLYTPERPQSGNYGGSIFSIMKPTDTQSYSTTVDRLLNMQMLLGDDQGSIYLYHKSAFGTTINNFEAYDWAAPGQSNEWTFIAASVDDDQTEYTFPFGTDDTRFLVWQPSMGGVTNATMTSQNASSSGDVELALVGQNAWMNIGGGPRLWTSIGSSDAEYMIQDAHPGFIDNVRFYDRWLTSNELFTIIAGDLAAGVVNTNESPYLAIPNENALLYHWDFNGASPLESKGIWPGTLEYYNSPVVSGGVLTIDSEPEGLVLPGDQTPWELQRFMSESYLGVTVMMWVNLGDPQNPDTWEFLLSMGGTSGDFLDGWGLMTVSGDAAGYMNRSGFSFEYDSGAQANLVHDQWRHLTFEWQVGQYDPDLTPARSYMTKMWVDGTNYSESVMNYTKVGTLRWNGKPDINIGFGYSTNELYSGGSAFFGEIDDVRIYSKVNWTTNEIEAVMTEDPH